MAVVVECRKRGHIEMARAGVGEVGRKEVLPPGYTVAPAPPARRMLLAAPCCSRFHSEMFCRISKF
jgi:hypothetical protein